MLECKKKNKKSRIIASVLFQSCARVHAWGYENKVKKCVGKCAGFGGLGDGIRGRCLWLLQRNGYQFVHSDGMMGHW